MAKRSWIWLKRVTIGFFSLILALIIVTSSTFDLMIHHGRYRDVLDEARQRTTKSQDTVFFRGEWTSKGRIWGPW